MPSIGIPSSVEINGYALREIRVRTGVEIAPLAEQVGVTRSYLAKIELGHSKKVSAQVYVAIISALDIRDRRVLLASPHSRDWVNVA